LGWSCGPAADPAGAVEADQAGPGRGRRIESRGAFFRAIGPSTLLDDGEGVGGLGPETRRQARRGLGLRFVRRGRWRLQFSLVSHEARVSVPSGPAPLLSMVKESAVSVPRRGGRLEGGSCCGSEGTDGWVAGSAWSVIWSIYHGPEDYPGDCRSDHAESPDHPARRFRSKALPIAPDRNAQIGQQCVLGVAAGL
jgi:hypothetical protein